MKLEREIRNSGEPGTVIVKWCGLNLLTQRIVASAVSVRPGQRSASLEWIVSVQLFRHRPQRVLALVGRCRIRLVLLPVHTNVQYVPELNAGHINLPLVYDVTNGGQGE